MALNVTAIPGTNKLRVQLSVPVTPQFVMSMMTPRFGPAPLGALEVTNRGALGGTWVGDMYVAETGESGNYSGGGGLDPPMWVPGDVSTGEDAVEGQGLGFSIEGFLEENVPGYTEVQTVLPSATTLLEAGVKAVTGQTIPTGAPGPPPVPYAKWDNVNKIWYYETAKVTQTEREMAARTLNGLAAKHGIDLAFAELRTMIGTRQYDGAKKKAESLMRTVMLNRLVKAVALGLRVSQPGAYQGQLASDVRNKWVLDLANIINGMPEASRPDTSTLGLQLGPTVTVTAGTPAAAALTNGVLLGQTGGIAAGTGVPGIDPVTGAKLPNGAAAPGGMMQGAGMWIGIAALAAAAFFLL